MMIIIINIHYDICLVAFYQDFSIFWHFWLFGINFGHSFWSFLDSSPGRRVILFQQRQVLCF